MELVHWRWALVSKYNRNDKLRIYYDAEFTGLNRNTSLISIGLVSDTGTSFYAEFTDYDPTQVTEWIQNNVIQNLIMTTDVADGCHFKRDYLYEIDPVKSMPLGYGGGMQQYTGSPLYNIRGKGPTDPIRTQLLKWLSTESEVAKKQIQFFTDCYAYDWLMMNNLICDYGDALNIPQFINYIPIDLSTLMWSVGIDPDISREDFAGPLKTLPVGLEQSKHNSLWDAYIAKVCFVKIQATTTIRFN
jgi:hypothetical protein